LLGFSPRNRAELLQKRGSRQRACSGAEHGRGGYDTVRGGEILVKTQMFSHAQNRSTATKQCGIAFALGLASNKADRGKGILYVELVQLLFVGTARLQCLV